MMRMGALTIVGFILGVMHLSLAQASTPRCPASEEIQNCAEHVFPKLNLSHSPQGLLLGYRHSCDTKAPESLVSQILEFKKAGFTDLVLEIIPQDQGSYFAGLLDVARHGGEFAKSTLEAQFGTGFVAMVTAFESAGLKVTLGDIKHGKGWTQAFDFRNQHFARTMNEMIKNNRKPILLVGSCHVGPVEALMKEEKLSSIVAYDASVKDGTIENAGLTHPVSCRGVNESSWNTEFGT